MTHASLFLASLSASARKLRLDGKILLAVSGGPDSVALLVGLAELAQEHHLLLEVATIDHGLRAGSRRDCTYVQRLCSRLDVPCTRRCVTVGREGGTEAAARQARYQALEEIASERGCAHIATAHTLEDQAETVLLRLGRGTGTRGLRGILPRRGRVVRPMLEISRSVIARFLASRRLRPRVDPTNASPRFDRNRVRAWVLPAVEQALGPSAIQAIARAATVARRDEQYLEHQAVAAGGFEVSRGVAGGDAAALAALHAALRFRVVRRAARAVGVSLSSRHVQEIEEALRHKRPSSVGLPGGFRFQTRAGRFTIARPSSQVAAPFAHRIDGVGQSLAGGWLVEIQEERRPRDHPDGLRVDPRRLQLPLWLRSRRPGDLFRPLGGHRKKLKAFLIDQKIPRAERDLLPLLCDDAGRVLWIVGVRASDAAAEGAEAKVAWRISVRASDVAPRALDTPVGHGVGSPQRAK